MRTLTHILASLLLVLMLGSSAQLWATRQSYTLSGIGSLRSSLDSRRPQVLLLGNSILQRGVDERLLARESGLECMTMFQEGAASAWWYLALKNVVAPSTHRPDRVYVLFRDYYLTAPTFRTQGKFAEQLDMLREAREPVLEARAEVAGQTMGVAVLNQAWPFYRVRYQYRRALERRAQHVVGAAFGISVLDLARLTDQVFAPENLDQELYTQQQQQAESAPDQSVYDFQSQVDGSFLPPMLEVARQHGLDLAFIRFRRVRDASGEAVPAELDRYIDDLEQYLNRHGSRLIDLTGLEELRPQHYADGDHLSEEGRLVFTRLLAEVIVEDQPPVPDPNSDL